MRKKLLLWALIGLGFLQLVHAQNAANYVFSTGTTGNFTTGLGGQAIDMSTGTATMIGPGLTNFASSTFPTNFEFFFNGTRFTSFSAATNGMIGPNALTAASVTLATATSNRISAFCAGILPNDMGTHITGKVHTKTFGTFPNRVTVVEFLNMSIPRSSGTADATFQARIYETTGVIEYVYGTMNVLTATSGVRIGLSTSITNYSTVNISSNTNSTSSIQDNNISTGAITSLNSPVEGSRRFYRFTPPTVAAPTLTIPSTTPGSILITVTAPAVTTNILGFGIYAYPTTGSLDIFGSYFGSLAGAAGFSTNLVGLNPNTSYNVYVFTYSEGSTSPTAIVVGTTQAPATVTSIATGNWSDGTTWSSGTVPARGDNIVIASGNTVTITTTTGASYMNNLTVNGTLGFSSTSTLTATGNVLVNSGGVLNMFNGATGITLNTNGNVTSNGTLDLSKASAVLGLLGTTNQSINGATANFVGSGAAGTPANTGIIRSLSMNNAAGVTLNTPIIVSNALTLTNGSLTTNGNLTLDNTQTSTGVTAPASISISRTRLTGQIAGIVNFGTNATTNVTYQASTFGITGTFTAGAEIPTSGILNNLAVQNTDGANFTNSLFVRGTLTMSSNLNLGSNNITIGASAALPGTLTYSQGFLNTTGTVTRWFGTTAVTLGTSAGLFPIGIGTTTNRTFSVGGTPTVGGTLSVKFNNVAGTTPFTTPFTENSILYDVRSNSNWDVSAGNGLATGSSFSIRGQASNISGVTAFSSLNTSVVNGIAPGGFSSGTSTNLDPQVNRSSLSEVQLNNAFYIAGTLGLNPLPLSLLTFNGTLKNSIGLLNWSTATEVNTNKFEVERSNNGNSNWGQIGTVIAKGGNNKNDYSLSDTKLLNGKNYYRLKIIDNDGKFTYSPIVVLDVNGKNQFVLNQNYPNPVSGFTTIGYQLGKPSNVILEILTIDGRLISKINNGSQDAGYFILNYNASNLANGKYIYKLTAIDNATGQIISESKKMDIIK